MWCSRWASGWAVGWGFPLLPTDLRSCPAQRGILPASPCALLADTRTCPHLKQGERSIGEHEPPPAAPDDERRISQPWLPCGSSWGTVPVWGCGGGRSDICPGCLTCSHRDHCVLPPQTGPQPGVSWVRGAVEGQGGPGLTAAAESADALRGPALHPACFLTPVGKADATPDPRRPEAHPSRDSLRTSFRVTSLVPGHVPWDQVAVLGTTPAWGGPCSTTEAVRAPRLLGTKSSLCPLSKRGSRTPQRQAVPPQHTGRLFPSRWRRR